MRVTSATLTMSARVSLDDSERFVVRNYRGREVRVFSVYFAWSAGKQRVTSVVGTFIRKDGSDYADAVTVEGLFLQGQTIPASVEDVARATFARLLAEAQR